MAKTHSAGKPRPLSPHLQVYRWPLTMFTSILHRATGVGNGVGTLLLAAWFFSLAQGEEAFNYMNNLLASPVGKLVMFGFTFSVIYHTLNGVRHLFWDVGKGFEKDTSHKSGVLVLFLTIVLSLGIWFLGYANAGAAS